MPRIRIYMYTKGTGSGHLTRINAIYKGFIRARIKCDFYASAYRSKYLDFLESGIIQCDEKIFPKNIDIFICDWKADNFINVLPKKMAKAWIGLRRLGKIKSKFPEHYHVIAIEPDVKGDICIWPIISTWPDELVTKRRLKSILVVKTKKEIGLLCENGAYPKHIDRVFNHILPKSAQIFQLSNSPFAEEKKYKSYYPIARMFKAADYLVIGGGYNSVHEVLSYANLDKTTIINVGGDDQTLRINKLKNWEKERGSRAHILAKYITDYYLRRKKQE